MHFHAEHALFFERSTSLRRAVLSFTITVGVLVTNTWASSALISSIGAGVGTVLLLVAYLRGHRRLEPVLAWTLTLVAFAMLGGIVFTLEMGALVEATSRVLCGWSTRRAPALAAASRRCWSARR